MTTNDHIGECERTVERIRQNIREIHARQDLLRRRIGQLRESMSDFDRYTESVPNAEGGTDRILRPPYRYRKSQIEGEIRGLQDELNADRVELEYFRTQLHLEERKCWELRRQPATKPPTEGDLRKTIDDPRYWRDGDSELAAFVGEGFKRLYPDEAID